MSFPNVWELAELRTMQKVSILVLVDVLPELHLFNLLTYISRVSILVLVDVFPEHTFQPWRNPSKARFQSLF